MKTQATHGNMMTPPQATNTSLSSRPLWASLTLTAAVALELALGPAGAQDRHCLLGVFGEFASGYAGVLARHGIPYEILLERQLTEVSLLSRYDAILAATAEPQSYQEAARPIEQYVRAGGSFMFDVPRSAPAVAQTVRDQSTFLAEALARSQGVLCQAAKLRPAALDLFGPGVSATDNWLASRVSCDVHLVDRNATVVAEYAEPATVCACNGDKAKGARALQRGDPAIVMVRRGKGRYVVCGSLIAAAQARGLSQTDRLVLALVWLLTGGRAIPQLEAEEVELGNDQSKWTNGRSLSATAARCGEAPSTKGPGARSGLPATAELLEMDAGPEFDVSGTYSGAGQGNVWLDYWNTRNHLRVEFKERRAEAYHLSSGVTCRAGRLNFGAGKQRFVLQRRQGMVRLYVGHNRLAIRQESPCVGSVGCLGEALRDIRYQPVAPVYFADDFMREKDQPGEWETVAGTWNRLSLPAPDMAANPFAFHVEAQSAALATAGHRFWDTYRFRASVRPDSTSGRVGLMAYRQDEGNYLMFRCGLVEKPKSVADGFQLVRAADGVERVLEARSGGLVAGQCYLIEIEVSDKWIGAFVDGEKVLTAVDTSLSGGGIGLWADSAQARFDDVVVGPANPNLRRNRGVTFDSSLPSYAGVLDRDTWAGPAMRWQASQTQRALFWNRGVFYNDISLRFDMRALKEAGGTAELIINAAPARPDTGYALKAVRSRGRVAVEMLRREMVVRSAAVRVAEGRAPVLALRREGKTLYGCVNGCTVLKYVDPAPSPEYHRIAFRFSGGLPKISDVTYWSDSVSEYSFDTAPTDWWIGSGTWDVTNRWSCSPGWTWFGGTSPHPGKGCYEGLAAIWCKRRFEGDHALDYFIGPKMLEDANGEETQERLRDFNAVLCGNGRDVDSGYAFVVGPGGANEAKLLKQGTVVARSANFAMPRSGHNYWSHLRVQKDRNRLRLFFDGQLLLEHKDDHPLPGGYCGIWTQDNGILIPNAAIYYQRRGGPLLPAVCWLPPTGR